MPWSIDGSVPRFPQQVLLGGEGAGPVRVPRGLPLRVFPEVRVVLSVRLKFSSALFWRYVRGSR